jgi:hypothetical protein
MKKLSVLLVVLVMLGICSSSYGYFLIYKLTGSVTGMDDANKVSLKFKGYLAMSLDDSNSLLDANMIIDGTDRHGHKLFVLLNSTDSNNFLDASVLQGSNKRNFYELHGNVPFDFNAFMEGDVKSSDIGLPKKKHVATNLSGSFAQENGILVDLNQNITGVGRLSASLYTVATKGVNDPNNGDPLTPHTMDGIVAALVKEIEDDHYTEVSVPAPR